MDDRISDVIQLAVEYITLAVFLIACLTINGLKTRYTRIYNLQTELEQDIQCTLKYGKYTSVTDIKRTVRGIEVIAAIKEHEDGDIRIYVHPADGREPIDITAFNNNKTGEYLKNNTLDMENLVSIVDVSGYYLTYVIYDNDEMYDAAGNYKTSHGVEVSGITFEQVE